MAGNEDVPLGICSEMVTLTGLLTKDWVYKVPPYQRPYSWTEEEVDCLVEDLRVATAFSYPYYFMGQVIVQPEDGEALIIDGQQRMVTLTIMLAYLRDRTANRDLGQRLQCLIMTARHSGQRILLRPMDRALFRTHVQQPGQIDALIEAADFDVKPRALVQRAARAIAEALNDKTSDERDKLAEFMLSRLTFNLIETIDNDGASALFRVINHRGQRPSESSIMKSEMLARAGFDDEEASRTADRWDSLEDDFDERGIADFWSMIEVIVTGQAPLHERSNPRSLRARIVDKVEAQRFLREDLWRYEYALRAIQQCDVDAGEASEEVNRRLACMQLYKEKAWLAPAVALVADHKGDAEFMRRFFIGLDRLTFACIMSVIRNQSRFERFARVVRARGDEQELFGPKGALQLTSTQQHQVIMRLNAPINVDDDRGRIIAYRLNAALPNGQVLSTRDDATLEHILPKSDTEYWRRKFPDEKARKEYTYLIGNFCLLKKKQNDDAANKSWPEKRKVYFETRGAPLRALTATVRDVEDWDELALRKRHVALVGVLCEDLQLV